MHHVTRCPVSAMKLAKLCLHQMGEGGVLLRVMLGRWLRLPWRECQTENPWVPTKVVSQGHEGSGQKFCPD